MKGKAEFVQAEQNRKIKIQEASAMKESAVFYADAEIIRAKGVAKANEIIAGGLKGNGEYLRYLWINAMGEKDDKATFYIPTGSDGLPIMKSVE
jgi:regulator of protease activity HflC (stomatin/prohibitin superfamily)